MIRLYILVILLTLFTSDILPQQDDTTGRRRKLPEGNGNISGTVIDRDSKQPLAGVVIQIFKSTKTDSSKLKGGETDESGKYNIEVPYGRYRVDVSYVGYNDATVSGITVMPNNPNTVLDTIRLKQGGTTTEEIEVTADKSPVQFTADKKIFNVSQNPINSTGTATDVLRTVPSISVDTDGNVSLRGSGNVRIFVDGRPVFQNPTSLLASIPANMVESVELITNPGAKYDAEGESGIINLVLKKNTGFGYNGVLTLGAGTKDKYNGGINLNLKNDNINIFGNYGYNVFNFGMTGSSFRQNYTGTVAFLDQPSFTNMRMKSHNGKLGFDYQITPQHWLSLSASYRTRDRSRDGSTTNISQDISRTTIDQSETRSTEDEKGANFETNLSYLFKFKTPKQTLSIDAVYNRSDEDENQNNTTHYSITNYNPVTSQPYTQLVDQKEKLNSGYFEAGYVHPFSKESQLEAGYKLSGKKSDNDYFSQHLDTNTNTYVDDIALNNHFNYNEFINAGYVTYSNKIKDFGFQLGLRVENTYTKGDLVTTGETFTKKYTGFFPSVNLSQKIGLSNELQLTYSRRLNRPRGGDLNPFTESSDPYNIRRGNPDLNPEYINSFELSYLRFFPGTFLTGTVFYRKTDDLISRFRTNIDSVTTLTYPVNLSKSNSYGVELIANTQPVDWLSLNTSFSYFNTKIVADNVQSDLTNSGNSWTAKANATFKMWGGINLTVLYNYQGRRPTALGYIEAMQSVDAAAKKDFMGGRLSIGLRAGDIFNQQKMNMVISQPDYTQTNIRMRDSQSLFLTLTYKMGTIFDQKKQQPPRRKKPEDNNEGDDDF